VVSAAAAPCAEAPFPEKQQRQPAGEGADDGRDALINRLGRWSDPVAVAKAHTIAAQIWSDYQQGVFDRDLMAYQPLINGKEEGLLEAVKARSKEKRQAAAIHAYRVLKRYGKPIRNRGDAEAFLSWLRDEGLTDCTIAGLMTHYRQYSGGNRHMFSYKLKCQRSLKLCRVKHRHSHDGRVSWRFPLSFLHAQ